MPKKKLKFSKAIAKEKVKELFEKASKIAKTNLTKANEHVKTARKVAMKSRIRIQPDFKRKFCKYCYSYLIPGQNLRVRTQDGKVVYYCKECNKFWRMPLNTKHTIKSSLNKD